MDYDSQVPWLFSPPPDRIALSVSAASSGATMIIPSRSAPQLMNLLIIWLFALHLSLVAHCSSLIASSPLAANIPTATVHFPVKAGKPCSTAPLLWNLTPLPWFPPCLRKPPQNIASWHFRPFFLNRPLLFILPPSNRAPPLFWWLLLLQERAQPLHRNRYIPETRKTLGWAVLPSQFKQWWNPIKPIKPSSSQPSLLHTFSPPMLRMPMLINQA